MGAPRGAARSTAVVFIVALLAAALAACSGSGSEGGAGEPDVDRAATEDRVAGDWDVEFNILIANRSPKEVEVGLSLDPNPGGIKEQSVSATPSSAWRTAGDTKLLVVPAATAPGTPSVVNLYVQEKLSTPRESTTTNKPAAIGEVHDLMVQLPTLQLRFKTTYVWASNDCRWNGVYPGNNQTCDNTRGSNVAIQTRFGNGYQWGWTGRNGTAGIASCLNPVVFTEGQNPLRDPSDYWNEIPTGSLDVIGLEIRSPEQIAKDTTSQCPTGQISAVAPSLTLSAPSSNGDATSLNLAGRQLTNTNLAGSGLAHANLQGTQFIGTARPNLAYADLSGAKLQGTNFENAILTGADFEGATINAATSFDGAVLFDVDLTKAAFEDVLPWSQFTGAKFCRTVLPQETLDSWTAKDGEAPNMQGDCKLPISSFFTPPSGGILVDTSSAAPLTLLTQRGTFDCPRPSTVGAFDVIPANAGCPGVYGSSRLPLEPTDGQVVISSTASSPKGGLAVNATPLGSWGGFVCLAELIDPKLGGCGAVHPDPTPR